MCPCPRPRSTASGMSSRNVVARSTPAAKLSRNASARGPGRRVNRKTMPTSAMALTQRVASSEAESADNVRPHVPPDRTFGNRIASTGRRSSRDQLAKHRARDVGGRVHALDVEPAARRLGREAEAEERPAIGELADQLRERREIDQLDHEGEPHAAWQILGSCAAKI